MSDKVEKKKKIYQVAKEINISHDTLIEYLQKKGHTVKSHMSTVDEGMLHDILTHFKKEKEVAERHQKKIQILRETRKITVIVKKEAEKPTHIIHEEHIIPPKEIDFVKKELNPVDNIVSSKHSTLTLSPLVKSSQELIVHALEHFTTGDSPLDFKLTITHLDQAVELLLKEKVRLFGKHSIYKKDGKTTIGIIEAYQLLEESKYSMPEKVDLEMLHDERNIIQHKYANPDEDTTSFHVENALRFLERFFYEEFSIKLPNFVPPRFLNSQRLRVVPLDKKIQAMLKSAAANVLRDPSSAVLSISTALDSVLLDVYKTLSSDRNVKMLTRKNIVRELTQTSKINDTDSNKIIMIFDTRNRIAHTDYVPSSDEAEKILTDAMTIIEKLKS